VSVEPRFPGTPGGTLQPSRMAQLLPVEYPYGGAVGSEDWEPNSPSGALDPCAMSRFGDMTVFGKARSTFDAGGGNAITGTLDKGFDISIPRRKGPAWWGLDHGPGRLAAKEVPSSIRANPDRGASLSSLPEHCLWRDSSDRIMLATRPLF